MKTTIQRLTNCLILALCMLLPKLAHAEITFSNSLSGGLWDVQHAQSLITGDDTDIMYNFHRDEQTGCIIFDIYDDNFNVVKSFSVESPEFSVKYSDNEVTTFGFATVRITSQYGGVCRLFKPYFGTSGKYEYCIPLMSSNVVSFHMSDGTIVKYAPINGFAVKAEDGAEVMSVRFPSGYYSSVDGILNVNCHVVNSRLKALVMVVDKQGEWHTLVYDFGSADAGARTVACSPKLVNICPTLVSEGEAVKVTMGEEVDGPKEISVVSVDGSVVYRVSTSDNTVSIPAALLPRGMNIVSVTYSDGSQETSRIMVR